MSSNLPSFSPRERFKRIMAHQEADRLNEVDLGSIGRGHALQRSAGQFVEFRHRTNLDPLLNWVTIRHCQELRRQKRLAAGLTQ